MNEQNITARAQKSEKYCDRQNVEHKCKKNQEITIDYQGKSKSRLGFILKNKGQKVIKKTF